MQTEQKRREIAVLYYTTNKQDGRPQNRVHLTQQANMCKTATHWNKTKIRPTNR
jgi:Holliday junction resolvase-like predicted endonuclease